MFSKLIRSATLFLIRNDGLILSTDYYQITVSGFRIWFTILPDIQYTLAVDTARQGNRVPDSVAPRRVEPERRHLAIADLGGYSEVGVVWYISYNIP